MTKIFKTYPFVVVLVLMTIVFGILSPTFLDLGNLTNILKQASLLGFVALGMCFVLIGGGLDLSVGSIVALSSVLIAGLSATLPPIVGIHVALLAGILIGVANGYLVTAFNFQPIIVTISTMAIVRGIAMAYSDSRPIFGTLPDELFLLADGVILGLPVPAILFFLACAISVLFLRYTDLGRQIYQVGGNEEAARLAGINVARVKIVTYAISGFLSSFAGLMLVARMQSGEAVRTGIGWELDAIAAAAIGGVSLMGGIGTVVGTLCGALIIGMMANAFNLLGVNPYWQRIVIGIVLAIAVASYSSGNLRNWIKRFRPNSSKVDT
ncbi:ABC transporter permease [Roseovarius sp. 2305UL8-3]|uniref:ABC transporter permease n=1 Tax=Roseovarius conchicola TaxID=3121636 RepID=UPI003526D1EB